ncbi:hypothetical protein STH2269 [Symbiobacterium thermophilum IAM 14863]|uniref:Uncharacterized protein n=1 Tax=Symbiobacterium thermophilum (strain DSM 24528 / JCM 14929 / IAM 14863 / T) TaxID=292459 RepID=Q67M41_SYMTH|nr:hypothetical protein STH2269 [Symbiobacterium thermophilum IAM 14863]
MGLGRSGTQRAPKRRGRERHYFSLDRHGHFSARRSIKQKCNGRWWSRSSRCTRILPWRTPSCSVFARCSVSTKWAS